MKILVVGYGSIARKHLDNLRLCYPHAQLAVWCRPGLPRDETGLCGLFYRAEEAIAWQPDYVIIASPASRHAEHVATFSALGVPLLIEKPLAATLPQGERLLCCLQGPARLGYQLRYTEGYAALRQWLPLLGPLCFARLEVGQYLPSWRPQTPVNEMVSARPDLGGGALLELSHELDLLVGLLGLPATIYGAQGPQSPLQLSVEESVELTLRYDTGSLIQIHLDMLQYKPCRRSKWLGASGQIEWNMLENLLIHYDIHGREVQRMQGHLSGPEVARRQLMAFIAQQDQQAVPEDGLLTLRVIDAARRSINSGQEERVYGG